MSRDSVKAAPKKFSKLSSAIQPTYSHFETSAEPNIEADHFALPSSVDGLSAAIVAVINRLIGGVSVNCYIRD